VHQVGDQPRLLFVMYDLFMDFFINFRTEIYKYQFGKHTVLTLLFKFLVPYKWSKLKDELLDNSCLWAPVPANCVFQKLQSSGYISIKGRRKRKGLMKIRMMYRYSYMCWTVGMWLETGTVWMTHRNVNWLVRLLQKVCEGTTITAMKHYSSSKENHIAKRHSVQTSCNTAYVNSA